MIVPERRRVEGFRVAGVASRTDNAAEADPRTAKLPALWGAFAEDSRIQGLGGPPVGVVTGYESDETGAYTSLAGVRVGPDAAVPSGLAVVDVPAGDYLVFHSEGPVPNCVIDGWRAVWSYFGDPAHGRRAFRVDAEVYGEGFVDLLISVPPPDGPCSS